MPTAIKAIYRDGVFHPVERVPELADNQVVYLQVAAVPNGQSAEDDQPHAAMGAAAVRSRPVQPGAEPRWSDKNAIKASFDRLFAELSIRSAPVDIQDLQQRMGEAGFAPNEFSRDIIEARDE